MMLASCGKEVKIHEWPDGALIGGVSSINGVTFKGLSWSYPGNKLLAVPSGHCPILLQECNNEEVIDDVFWADTLKGLNCGVESGVFPNTSDNYVTVGLATGELITYDTYGQEPTRNHATLPEPISFLDYSYDDTLLAAGCRNGQIYFYDSNGITSTSLHVPFSNSLSAMMFHPYSDSYIIGGSKEGILAGWDVSTAIIKFQFQNHENTVTGICIAPHDEQLISVSLDKKVLFYDLRTNMMTNTFSFGVELTAVAYFKPNEDVLVGTCEGRVMCFDRRRPSVLKYSFESQKNAPVKCISFNSRSNLQPKCAKEPNCLPTAHEETPQPVASIMKLGDFVKREDVEINLVSHVPSVTEKTIELDEGSEILVEIRPGCPPIQMGGEGSETPFYQVIEENSLRALKQEIINTNKEIMRKFMEDITDQFLKIRMEVSREFCHLEQIQNQKWKEFHNKLSKLAARERKAHLMLDSQMSEGSESYRLDSSRYDAKRDEFGRKK